MNNAISAEMTADSASEPIEVLNKRYADLEQQWQEMRSKRNNEVTRRLAELDQAHIPDPWIAAGIAGIYGKDPFSAYNQASLVPQAYQKEKYALLNENLSDQEKELAGLMKSVQARLAAKNSGQKRQMIGSADQGWWAYNFDTDEKKLLVPGTLQQKQSAQLREIILNRLKEDGGDMTEHAKNADKLAKEIIYSYSPEEVDSYINGGGLPGSITHGAVEPKSGTTVAIGDPNLKGSGIFTPGQMEVIKADVAKDKTVLPNVVGKQVATGPLIVKTPEQKSFDTTTGKNWADEIPKLAESIKANEAKLGHFDPMESMLMAGNLPSGPLHEYLKTVGDLASTYDPKGELAKRYGNDTPAYFGSLMNLVRSDIKALGAGTAVSNLDLIVSQMAAGDLRNSPQGNLKLIGLMKYVAAEKAAHDKKYMKYIQDTGRGTDFVSGKKLPPEYALRRKPNAKGLEQYVLIDRAQYEKEFEAKFKKKPTTKQWEDYSKASVGMMFNGDGYVKRN